MDETQVLLALKSTLDKVMLELREELLPQFPTLRAAEVEDLAQTDETHKSADPALLWSLGPLQPEPRPPLYRAELIVGAKTTADPSNYQLLDLLSYVRAKFAVNDSILLCDYSKPDDGAAPDTVGSLFVTANEIMPQEFDRQSGIRYAVVRGRVAAYG